MGTRFTLGAVLVPALVTALFLTLVAGEAYAQGRQDKGDQPVADVDRRLLRFGERQTASLTCPASTTRTGAARTTASRSAPSKC
jgi:hypothetical protein